MASAANVLNNTILVPTGGSLNNLPTNTVGTDVSAYNQAYNNRFIEYQSDNPIEVHLKVKGENAVKMVMVQGSVNLGMTREYTQMRSGGNSEYVVNLPGPVSYSDATFGFVFLSQPYFLDWVTNGCLVNGVTKADLEIHLNAKNTETNQKMILTLRDAFPTSWSLGFLKLYDQASKTQPLLEMVTFSYSRVDFGVTSA